jgi:UDP-N-acetylmuramate dehydrogenase
MTPGLRLTRNAPLATRNTFAVPATAPWLVEVQHAGALSDALALPQLRDAAPLVLGGGSNLLFAGDAPGAVLSIQADSVVVLDEHDGVATVRAEAGMAWHALVRATLALGLQGFENLALIPGTTGASPIQNIGAYGTEISEFVHCVEAYDLVAGELVRLPRAACGFAYRDSVFKRQADRYVVLAVEFALPRQRELRLDYAGIGDELLAMGVAAPRAPDVATAVERIRRRKLPDPAVVGNAGSFFKNPIVDAALADALGRENPGLPQFRGDGEATRKLSAGWLIDACGWKGHREGDAGVAGSHALVLVNHGTASGAQLLDLARRIAASVQARFGVALEPEPRIIGASWSDA